MTTSLTAEVALIVDEPAELVHSSRSQVRWARASTSFALQSGR